MWLENPTFSSNMTTSMSRPGSDSCELANSHLYKTSKLAILTVLGSLGIIGNIFIIVLAVKYTVRKNLHHLIINMAASDTIVIVALISLKIPKTLQENWFEIYGGNATCRLISFSLVSSIFISFFTLLIISIQRFRSTALERPRPYTTRKRLAELAVSWLASLFMAYAKTSNHSINKTPSGVYLCTPVNQPLAWEICFCTVVVLVFCTIFILSTATLRRLANNQPIQDSLPDIQRQARKKKMASAIKMVLSSFLLYSCCYLPFTFWQSFKIFSIIKNGTGSISCFGVQIVEFLSRSLSLVNSCFSPVIYLIFLRDFRQAAKRLVCRKINPFKVRRAILEQGETIEKSVFNKSKRIRQLKNETEEGNMANLLKITLEATCNVRTSYL